VSDPDFERVPDPDMEADNQPFDFSALTAENTDSLTGDFTPPNVKGSKPRWWERAPKSGKNARAPRERKARPVPAMPRGGLKPALAQMYTGIGMAVMPFDPACGRVVIENAESCAAALDELAKTNPAVRRVLLSLVTTSAWGAVIMAHAPILMAVAMHHVPALREKQEKMVGEMAEMFANGFGQQNGETEK
jgi:hypothetical protein